MTHRTGNHAWPARAETGQVNLLAENQHTHPHSGLRDATQRRGRRDITECVVPGDTARRLEVDSVDPNTDTAASPAFSTSTVTASAGNTAVGISKLVMRVRSPSPALFEPRGWCGFPPLR